MRAEGKAEVKWKDLRGVLNCERELLCRMWGGRLFQTRGAWTENDRRPQPLSFHFAQKRVCFFVFVFIFFIGFSLSGSRSMSNAKTGRKLEQIR